MCMSQPVHAPPRPLLHWHLSRRARCAAALPLRCSSACGVDVLISTIPCVSLRCPGRAHLCRHPSARRCASTARVLVPSSRELRRAWLPERCCQLLVPGPLTRHAALPDPARKCARLLVRLQPSAGKGALTIFVLRPSPALLCAVIHQLHRESPSWRGASLPGVTAPALLKIALLHTLRLQFVCAGGMDAVWAARRAPHSLICIAMHLGYQPCPRTVGSYLRMWSCAQVDVHASILLMSVCVPVAIERSRNDRAPSTGLRLMHTV